MMLGWFDSREAAQAGAALAEGFAPKGALQQKLGRRPEKAIEELLRRADHDVRPLRLNFYKKAKFANSFKWRLIENGVDPAVADNVTQSLILHLSSENGQSIDGAGSLQARGANPTQVRQLMVEAKKCFDNKAFAEAERIYHEIIEIEPDHLEAQTQLGAVLCRLGRYAEAEQCFRRTTEIKPDASEAHWNLGSVLRWRGEMAEAETEFRLALKLRPNYVQARIGLGFVLAFWGRLREARARFEKALKAEPRNAEALFGLGHVAKLEGRFEEAERFFKRVLEIDPPMSSALAALPSLRRMTPADGGWLDRAKQFVASGVPPLEEADVRFAMGKYYDDIDDFASAFENYRRGNELLRNSVAEKYKREGRSFFVSEQIRVYTRDLIRRVGEGGSDSTRPVFVVGMMRSGTSLAEQIIASHPSASGAGELGFWSEAVQAHEGEARQGMPNVATKRKLAGEYLHVLAEHSSDALRVVDKAPINFDHLGVIHSVFPNARIICMRRDPIDTCLSCYFQQFSVAMKFSMDLGDLAHYWRQHQCLMTHWRTVLPPDRFLEVPYEELVTDPAEWTRRMLEFIGLPWNDRCLDFHQTKRSVVTASAWQVRQKMYTSSIGRWRHYERFIGPLKGLRNG